MKAKRAEAVASVATKLFGTNVPSDAVITESLERATDVALKSDGFDAALRSAVEEDLPRELDDGTMQRHPLAVWCEMEMGLRDGQRLSRREPTTLAEAAGRLAKQTGLAEDRCRAQLQSFLMLASQPEAQRGGRGERAFLAFQAASIHLWCRPRLR